MGYYSLIVALLLMGTGTLSVTPQVKQIIVNELIKEARDSFPGDEDAQFNSVMNMMKQLNKDKGINLFDERE